MKDNIGMVIRPILVSLFLLLFLLSLQGCGDNTQIMPDFELPDTSGDSVFLSQMLSENEYVVVLFYRGHF